MAVAEMLRAMRTAHTPLTPRAAAVAAMAMHTAQHPDQLATPSDRCNGPHSNLILRGAEYAECETKRNKCYVESPTNWATLS